MRDEVPLHASRVHGGARRRTLPEDAIIFDEALTFSPEITQLYAATLPGHYFQTRGGSLGVGIPGAIGAKVAHPDRTVVGFTGDGGSMYTIQALWTAAHHRIGAKFVILNNRRYMLLQLNIRQYWKDLGLPENPFPSCSGSATPTCSSTSCQGDGRRRRPRRDAASRSARRSTPRWRTTARSSSTSSSTTTSRRTSPGPGTPGRAVVTGHVALKGGSR